MNDAADVEVYFPADILEFGVHNEIFVRAVIDSDSLFLQTLLKAKKSLYYDRKSDGKETFYIHQVGRGFEPLQYKRYQTLTDGRQTMIENKKFIGQLTLYFSDCADIQSMLKELTYDQKSLIRIFSYYHTCTSSIIEYQKEVVKLKTTSGLIAGVSLTSLKFSGSSFDYLVYANFNLSVNPSAGLFFNLILPGNHEKWSLYNELLSTSYQVQGTYSEIVDDDYYSTTTTRINFTYLKINNLLRFNYKVAKMFIFVNGGISNAFAIGESNSKTVDTKFYGTERITTGIALEKPRRHELGLVAGAGVTRDKLSCELRYEKGNGISDYTSLNSSTNRFYLLLGYRF